MKHRQKKARKLLRAVLKGAGVAAAALMLNGCVPPISDEPVMRPEYGVPVPDYPMYGVPVPEELEQ